MTLNFFQKSVNECLEILIIIIVIKYRDLHSAISLYSVVIFLFHLLAVVNTKEVHFYIRHIGCCQRHSKVDFKTKRRLYLATHPVLGAFYVIFKTIHLYNWIRRKI